MVIVGIVGIGDSMVRASYTYFFDMQTSKDVITKVDIKYGGKYAQSAFIDYFTRFKYFKPKSIRINVKPCATLPVDPAGLSFQAGEQTVDPRDIFSLGMIRITNGENIPSPPSGMSADEVHKFYYTMMLDRRWYKFSPHKGIVKSAVPKMWAISETNQDKFPGNYIGVPLISYDSASGAGIPTGVAAESGVRLHYTKAGSQGQWDLNNVNAKIVATRYGSYFNTNRLRQNGLEPVRWMPTDEYVRVENVPSDNGGVQSLVNYKIYTLATVPEATIITMLFPPQYKTFSFFRIWVTEVFEFKGYVSNTGVICDTVSQQYASIDRFIRPNKNIHQADPFLASTEMPTPKLK